MWTYSQKTGELYHEGLKIATGYSGHGDGKNNPSKQDVQAVGPIPCGLYTIGSPHNTDKHGPYVLGLAPDKANDMHGRSAFLMHGDSKISPGNASLGCIILPRAIREQVWQSGDHRLMVVAVFTSSPNV